ncbi:MAG: hypothetical protein M0C28_30185 [Candidatus Moduliflexus flocculans]|nr:hypothetical protein [Candidatus Moduliflexus flocculans]
MQGATEDTAEEDSHRVSPYNFRGGFGARGRLGPCRIHDATLRDGEQTPGVVFRKDDKLAIARALDEAGVDRIEAGMPAVSREDFRGRGRDLRTRPGRRDLRLRPGPAGGRRPGG